LKKNKTPLLQQNNSFATKPQQESTKQQQGVTAKQQILQEFKKHQTFHSS